jgi:PIN domain nuclease of toxin-antitoxin system
LESSRTSQTYFRGERRTYGSANQRWLSPISIWELIILIEKKRVTLHEDMTAWLRRSKNELSLREAPVSWQVAQQLAAVTLGHRDPADRFLVATAKAYNLTLVTADERLMNVHAIKVLENR